MLVCTYGIPGQSAPASLKQLPQPALREFLERHSGAVCPGLIEAPPWRPASPGSHSGIPGQSAPASLKLADLIRLERNIAAHSGAVCPGLIEAS